MSIAVTTTDPTNTGVSTTSSSSLTGSNAADLQSSFLTLLVAQLKNQDPTNPMENNELTSQLAQISTVSGIEKLKTTLGSISGQIDNSQSLQASNLIGHGVMIPGTTVLAGTGSEEGAVTTTTPFGVELQQAADKVTATITDKNGAVVRTIDIGELTAGVHSFTWDGTLTDGTTAPNGSYNVGVPFNDEVPRIRIFAGAPGAPEVEVTERPAICPASAWSILFTAPMVSSEMFSFPTAAVNLRRSTV